MQTPPYQADANSKAEKGPAKMSFFCRLTPVFLQKAADFERHNLQGADFQMLPVIRIQDLMAFRSF
jgi:hypothetical protein